MRIAQTSDSRKIIYATDSNEWKYFTIEIPNSITIFYSYVPDSKVIKPVSFQENVSAVYYKNRAFGDP